MSFIEFTFSYLRAVVLYGHICFSATICSITWKTFYTYMLIEYLFLSSWCLNYVICSLLTLSCFKETSSFLFYTLARSLTKHPYFLQCIVLYVGNDTVRQNSRRMDTYKDTCYSQWASLPCIARIMNVLAFCWHTIFLF